MGESAGGIASLLQRLGKLYIENVKLTAAEKLTVAMSAGVLLVTTMILGMFALAFFAGACIELLAMVLPPWASYAILCGTFVLLIMMVYAFRRMLIMNPISKFVSRLILVGERNNNGMI